MKRWIISIIVLGVSAFGFWSSAYAFQGTLNVSIQGGGKVIGETARVRGAVINCGGTSGTDCSETTTSDNEIVITATPNSGFTFAGWISPTGGAGECVGQNNPCKLKLTQVTTSLIATFGHNITAITEGNGAGNVKASGTFTDGSSTLACSIQPPHACSKKVVPGAEVIFSATASTESTFLGWSGGTGSAIGCNGSKSNCSFDISTNSSIKGTFIKNPTLTISINGFGKVVQVGGAELCVNTASAKTCLLKQFAAGQKLILVANPLGGLTFERWSSGGSAAICNGSTDPSCVFRLNADSNVLAFFK
ncbi:hypothetical protein L0222_21095 [bacterium]|nr:hypothetical protein [bacterium]